MTGISFQELQRYTQEERGKWRAWLEKQPAAALEVPAGEAGTDTASVRGLLWHIAIVELFYAEFISGRQEKSNYRELPHTTLEEIWRIGDSAQEQLAGYLARAGEADLDAALTLERGSFRVVASRRKMLAHVFLHGLRHWAQLALVLRQHGYKTGWQHDFIFTEALP
ncbi:MAG TPA: DinB family protein [Terriglobales bacterium]|nr:DinB family protein [Terriglobales bacterium]